MRLPNLLFARFVLILIARFASEQHPPKVANKPRCNFKIRRLGLTRLTQNN